MIVEILVTVEGRWQKAPVISVHFVTLVTIDGSIASRHGSIIVMLRYEI